MNKRGLLTLVALLGTMATLSMFLVYGAASWAGDKEGSSAAPEPLAVLSSGPDSRPSEGIEVHGHWTIDILDADGSPVSHHEFRNAFQPSGRSVLYNFLRRVSTVGVWDVRVQANNLTGNSPCAQSSTARFYCIMTESSSTDTASYVFKNLTLTAPTSGTNANKLVLSGSATAQADGVIERVSTRVAACASSTTPDSCGSTTSSSNTNLFTEAVLTSAISVTNGQQIQVTVAIDFS